MENKSKNREIPSIKQSLIFKGKATLLQIKRTAENSLNSKLKFAVFDKILIEKPIIAESKTELWTESEPEERFLLAGKIQNLRLAVKKLNGLEVAANQVFSFWKQVGKANKFNGYVVGRELREGCIIPNIGGGLCQISNALYDAALQANFEIIERHAHTQVVQGSLAEVGRDATVFWNYVDLRFRSPNAFRIEAKLDAEHLILSFRGEKQTQKQLFQITKRNDLSLSHHPNSCATCGEESCFRMVKPEKNINFGKTAFLVDEFSPEFNDYIQKAKKESDLLFIPLDGKRFKKNNYAWKTNGFAEVRQSFLTTIIRSYKSRKLAAQGAERQKNLLEMAEKLAKSYAKNLRFDALHIVISQNILPFLWREGVLGGRTFDVLMTNLPIAELQKRLDFAHSLHPESKTLGDFRAEKWLIEAETEALKHASKIITSHSEIASLYSQKAELLDWNLPNSKNLDRRKNDKPVIAFPASTVGRKGAYELREALNGLDVKIMTFGANIEGDDFWKDFDVERGNFQNGWLEKADLVVLPSYLETKPRRLLEAAANKIPVIASSACGVENIENIEIIPFGDAEKLKLKLQNILAKL